MTDSKTIDRIYAELCGRVSSTDYQFEKFKGYWGFRSSKDYLEKKIDLVESVRRLAKDSAILYKDGCYYVFDGKIYITIREELVATAFDQLMEHLRIVSMVGDKAFCKKVFRDTIRFYNPLRPRPEIVAFSNGILDMTGMGSSPFYKPLFHEGFDSRYHVTYMHPYEYNERATCRRWMNFLHEVLPDKNTRLVLQMFMGLGLIERGSVYNPYEGKEASKVELCLILLGSGANGKSTIYDTAMGIFGKERISGVDYDELTATGDEGMRARSLLRDAIFNWSSDSDARTFGRKRTGVFKRIVSGESVTDRKIGENVRENLNIPFLIFNLNELPYPDDQSLGFIRRLQIIPFEITIPKNRQNPALSRELVDEYPGIFNWIMRGAKELRRRKFVFPSSEGNRRQMLLAQIQANPVAAWVNAYQMRWDKRATSENHAWIPTATMMASLTQFCEDNDVEPVSKQYFGHAMAKIGNGFFKKRFQEGFRYQVYGCTEEHLKEPFVIKNEDMHVDYIEERGTFIDEDD